MKIKPKDDTIQYVIEVLEKEVALYGSEFIPERVLKLKEYIKSLQGA